MTSHDYPSADATSGIKAVLTETGVKLSALSGFVQGTTLATNTLIERRGANVAAAVTAGFREIFEIAYKRHYSQYDINQEKPDLIVPHSRCFSVRECMSAAGELLLPLDEASIVELTEQIGTSGVDALAICLPMRTRIVFVASPGNPTGTYLPRRGIVRLRRGLADNILLVLDQAYGEIADTPGNATFDLVNRGDTVVNQTLRARRRYSAASRDCACRSKRMNRPEKIPAPAVRSP